MEQHVGANSETAQERPQPPQSGQVHGHDLKGLELADAQKHASAVEPDKSGDNVFAFAMANASAAVEAKTEQTGRDKKEEDQEWNEKDESSLKQEREEDDIKRLPDGLQGEESGAEIQNIMSQSDTAPAVTSPQSGSALPVFQYPPRSSSLTQVASGESSKGDAASLKISPTTDVDGEKTSGASATPTPTVPQPPLPEPEPEPDLPFDFHRFLEQLRHRTADPVAGYLRSFLNEFSKRQPPLMVHEQQKVISNFLTFISTKMAQCEVWRNVSDAEFDNAREGMEKLVMNRLYTQTFSPAIAPIEPKRRQKGAPAYPHGRRGQHQEDVERDEVLAQKVRIYGWICEEHLDMKPFSDKGRRFLSLAQQELSQVNKFRAPRDKVICILNCCKVLFGFLRNAQSDQSADAFIPLLIYSVLKANPEHLVSNVQYILRFRTPDKLSGEAGYYMSSLMGAVQFIENLDRTNLTISDEEFETSVEKAVSAIAERESLEEERRQQHQQRLSSDKPLPARPQGTSRQLNSSTASSPADGDPVAGILRTIQTPLKAIGRVFSDEPTAQPAQPSRAGSRPPPGARSSADLPPDVSTAPGAAAERQRQLVQEDAAARQASTEAAEAHTISRKEHQTVVETLAGMFPQLDKDVISDVVRMKEGRVGLAVDACLALSR